MKDKNDSKIRKALMDWFRSQQRDLPWRKDYSPYGIWISEIMLQQTQVKTVVPYFERWMRRFPDLPSLAGASEEELLKHWEGMGYYSRVRNIHKAAQILVEDFRGEFPRNHEAVLNLPGIGPYTAGAIMSLAFNEDFPLVDGNVERVFARLFDIDGPVKERGNQKLVWATARRLIPPGRAREFNQALMELGALVCVPRNPLCPECPARTLCRSFQRGIVDQRPVPGKRKAVQPIEAAIGILRRRGKIFIQKRPPHGLMPHLWEFPGGKLREGETPEEALSREFREELELDICCLDKITLIRHNYTSFRVTLHAYTCSPEDPDREPVVRSAVDSRWVTREELEDYAFPAANGKLIKLL